MVGLRRVGATELWLSEIGFGCGGNAGLMVRGEPAEQDRVVAHALGLGVSHFDTAPDYGDGAAESNLGRALRVIGGKSTVTTKIEIRAQDLGDIAGHVVRSTESSLRRLGRETIDVLQIHNGPSALPTALEGGGYKTLGMDDYLGPGGALEGVERILKSGKACYAGFVCRGDDALETAELLKTGHFALLNLPFTLLNPSAGYPIAETTFAIPDYGNVIAVAEAHGAGAAVFSPLAGGLLTNGVLDGLGTHPLARSRGMPITDLKPGALARRFADLAAALDLSLVEMAYRFVLAHRGVSTVLGGISSMMQLTDIVVAARKGPLPTHLMSDIREIWKTANEGLR